MLSELENLKAPPPAADLEEAGLAPSYRTHIPGMTPERVRPLRRRRLFP